MGEGTGHIFIVNEQDLAFAERIAGFAKKMGSRTVVIRAGELAAQGEGLTIPLFQSGYELQLVLVFQVLANELAATAGIDADEKVFPEFFSFVGTKTDFKKEAVTNDDSH
jgi:fructoselysine-6-P-deglycase FrlB-like protein